MNPPPSTPGLEGHPLPLPFPSIRPLVGMVHLLPLPGSPGWGGSMAEVKESALHDAQTLQAGGLDGIMVENFGDVPFYGSRVPSETVAAMAVVVAAVRSEVTLPVGVNVLRNDVRSALGIAAAADARFVRVNVHTGSMYTDQGLLRGRAGHTLRARRHLELEVPILADVMVKHATPPPGLTLDEAARDTWYRGHADVLIVSGSATGREVAARDLESARRAVPEARIWIGSGLTSDNLRALLPLCDGAIVGSALQDEGSAGGRVSRDRVFRFMEAAAQAGAR
jgi:membrane complex biogenesis BtpA family protein